MYHNFDAAVREAPPEKIKIEHNPYYDVDLLEEIEKAAKAEMDSAGYVKIGRWLNGSVIGGGKRIKEQYEFECRCITNMYGQRWTSKMGDKAHHFVQKLIAKGKLHEWNMNNPECYEFFPMSHVSIPDSLKSCRYHDHRNGKMERSEHCLNNCKRTRDDFEKWVRTGRRGPWPEPVQCKHLEPAEGRVVKVKLHATEAPHAPGSKTRMPYGLRKTERPLHLIVFGMHCPGVMTGRLLEWCLKNLNNLEYLQGNKFQLGLYGFGTHNACKRTDYSYEVFLKTLCRTLTKVGANVY